MLAPGSKGWIKKYLKLKEEGHIEWTLPSMDLFLHASFYHHFFARTGLVFGYNNTLLFANALDRSKWTQDESLKVCLFEALAFTHQQVNQDEQLNQSAFLAAATQFYKKHRVQSLSALLGYIFKEGPEDKLERILDKRTAVQRQLYSSKTWVSYLSNAFIYLDVILFEEFLKNGCKHKTDYQSLALVALAVIALSAASDGVIEESEKSLFETFLISADLDQDERELARLRLKNGVSLSEIEAEIVDLWSFRRYLLDLSSLTIFCNHEAIDEEKNFLSELTNFLQLTNEDNDEAIMLAQQFVLENQMNISYLKDDTSVEVVMNSISKRWIKVLGRNKDKLATELKQSKELVTLIRKSTSTELTKEEKEKVKTQFLDIIKSMPALAIFLLPGGAILLPIVLKIIPDLVPSAFRDNELEEKR